MLSRWAFYVRLYDTATPNILHAVTLSFVTLVYNNYMCSTYGNSITVIFYILTNTFYQVFYFGAVTAVKFRFISYRPITNKAADC